MKTNIRILPNREDFHKLAKTGDLIPIQTIVSMDTETPVTAYAKLRRKDGYSFLLEAAERTGVIGRYSIIGKDPHKIFRSNGKSIEIFDNDNHQRFETQKTPLEELRIFMNSYKYVTVSEMPPFSGGAVGYMGYDIVRFFEPNKLELAEKDELEIPEMIFMIAKNVVVFDHLTRRLHLISNAEIIDDNIDQAYDKASKSIHQIFDVLSVSSNLQNINLYSEAPVTEPESNTTKEEFYKMVETAKEYILSGDVFQVVLSQRFRVKYEQDPLDLYRMLWFINHSPYMFCIEFGNELTLVGSSPEVNVKVQNRKINIRPIAGTIQRGKDPEEDREFEKKLLSDPKELAEHLMLIDLARNDIGQIAEYGSVQVTEKFQIEKFSHVMHIVSNIEATLRNEFDSYDAMRLSFPAGTVSGAPKIRAMQIIKELEGNRRGAYSGAVGYFGFDGNMNSCIALRTVILKNGIAYIQAGAGIVADSTPEGEYEECLKKARGMIKAIAQAKAV